MAEKAVKRALISVFHKKGIVEFAQALVGLDWEIVSSGGTAKVLREAGISVVEVFEITDYPAILSHRVVTLHPKIHGGILAQRTKEHLAEVEKYDISLFGLVCVDLYPVEKAIVDSGATIESVMEMTDIGGPAMIRAAAKNHKYVTVICDPKDRERVIGELEKKGEVSLKTRQDLACKVFTRMASYDAAIDQFMAIKVRDEPAMRLHLTKGVELRYGENPHQRGWFYEVLAKNDPLAIQNFKQLHGKQLSFNNILDMDGAIYVISHFGGKEPVCVIVKHSNPCGLAIRDDILDAYMAAWNLGDPLAAFGSIIAVNRTVDEQLAREMLADNKFFEVLLAPNITVNALELLQTKKNLRVLINPALETPELPRGLDFKRVRGGMLVQEIDVHEVSEKDIKVATKVKPTEEQVKEMLFAWKVCKVSKSNSVVLTKNRTLIASGVGQQDRMRCCQLAVDKAKDRAKNCVAASDAFFPFRDGPDILIKAGVKAIIQPGGSIRDQQTIDACNEAGIAMVYTSKDPKKSMIRGFRH